jgi:sec-independent protein translocase protein TatC
LFVAGVGLCYYAMIPQVIQAFVKYSAWLGIKPQWTVASYVGFVTQFMLTVGLTFEVPLVILILVSLGVLRAETVTRSRKLMIALAVILAAILAPPDPLSMVVMAIPLLIMFEVTIWMARLVEKRRLRKAAARTPEPPSDPPVDRPRPQDQG